MRFPQSTILSDFHASLLKELQRFFQKIRCAGPKASSESAKHRPTKEEASGGQRSTKGYQVRLYSTSALRSQKGTSGPKWGSTCVSCVAYNAIPLRCKGRARAVVSTDSIFGYFWTHGMTWSHGHA